MVDGLSPVNGLSLEWKHCPDGVELVELPPPPPTRVSRIAGATRERGLSPPSPPLRVRPFAMKNSNSPGGMSFRARTSRRYQIKLEAADLEDPVVIHFINARDDSDRAQFLGRFGFLDHVDQSSCEYGIVSIGQSIMRGLLVSAGSAEPNVAAINEVLHRWRIDLFPVLEGRRLSFGLGSLHGLMLREIVMVVENEARFTTCQHCDKAFLTGPTTGRRSHAAYCSDRCRVAAMRARTAG